MRNARSVMICVFLLFCPYLKPVFSQDSTGWSKSFDVEFTMTQNSYSDSWAGGEAGSINWVANAFGIFEKQISARFNFKNSSKISFGQTHIQSQITSGVETTKYWSKPEKSTDLIDIENLGRLTLSKVIDPYIALRLETQFVDATVPSISRFFSPLKITESAGVAKIFFAKGSDDQSSTNELLGRVGFALRQIITREVTDTLLEKTKTTTTTDGGIESVIDLKLRLSKIVGFVSKLSLYNAIFFSEADEYKGTPREDYWKAIDINWENRFTASVAKYVTVSLYTQLLYDKEIDHRGRFKQTLAVGLTYKL